LALINGTQFSTAYALSALFDAWRNVEAAVVISALSTDAIMGSTATLAAEIHELRGQRGQIDVAGAMRSLMQALRFAKAIGTGTPAFRIRTASGVNRK
jgi:histidine ammonia-lyase